MTITTMVKQYFLIVVVIVIVALSYISRSSSVSISGVFVSAFTTVSIPKLSKCYNNNYVNTIVSSCRQQQQQQQQQQQKQSTVLFGTNVKNSNSNNNTMSMLLSVVDTTGSSNDLVTENHIVVETTSSSTCNDNNIFSENNRNNNDTQTDYIDVTNMENSYVIDTIKDQIMTSLMNTTTNNNNNMTSSVSIPMTSFIENEMSNSMEKKQKQQKKNSILKYFSRTTGSTDTKKNSINGVVDKSNSREEGTVVPSSSSTKLTTMLEPITTTTTTTTTQTPPPTTTTTTNNEYSNNSQPQLLSSSSSAAAITTKRTEVEKPTTSTIPILTTTTVMMNPTIPVAAATTTNTSTTKTSITATTNSITEQDQQDQTKKSYKPMLQRTTTTSTTMTHFTKEEMVEQQGEVVPIIIRNRKIPEIIATAAIVTTNSSLPIDTNSKKDVINTDTTSSDNTTSATPTPTPVITKKKKPNLVSTTNVRNDYYNTSTSTTDSEIASSPASLLFTKSMNDIVQDEKRRINITKTLVAIQNLEKLQQLRNRNDSTINHDNDVDVFVSTSNTTTTTTTAVDTKIIDTVENNTSVISPEILQMEISSNITTGSSNSTSIVPDNDDDEIDVVEVVKEQLILEPVATTTPTIAETTDSTVTIPTIASYDDDSIVSWNPLSFFQQQQKKEEEEIRRLQKEKDEQEKQRLPFWNSLMLERKQTSQSDDTTTPKQGISLLQQIIEQTSLSSKAIQSQTQVKNKKEEASSKNAFSFQSLASQFTINNKNPSTTNGSTTKKRQQKQSLPAFTNWFQKENTKSIVASTQKNKNNKMKVQPTFTLSSTMEKIVQQLQQQTMTSPVLAKLLVASSLSFNTTTTAATFEIEPGVSNSTIQGSVMLLSIVSILTVVPYIVRSEYNSYPYSDTENIIVTVSLIVPTIAFLLSISRGTVGDTIRLFGIIFYDILSTLTKELTTKINNSNNYNTNNNTRTTNNTTDLTKHVVVESSFGLVQNFWTIGVDLVVSLQQYTTNQVSKAIREYDTFIYDTYIQPRTIIDVVVVEDKNEIITITTTSSSNDKNNTSSSTASINPSNVVQHAKDVIDTIMVPTDLINMTQQYVSTDNDIELIASIEDGNCTNSLIQVVPIDENVQLIEPIDTATTFNVETNIFVQSAPRDVVQVIDAIDTLTYDNKEQVVVSNHISSTIAGSTRNVFEVKAVVSPLTLVSNLVQWNNQRQRQVIATKERSINMKIAKTEEMTRRKMLKYRLEQDQRSVNTNIEQSIQPVPLLDDITKTRDEVLLDDDSYPNSVPIVPNKKRIVQAIFSPEPLVNRLLQSFDETIYTNFIRSRSKSIVEGYNIPKLTNKLIQMQENEKKEEMTRRTMLQYRLQMENQSSLSLINSNSEKQSELQSELREQSTDSAVVDVLLDSSEAVLPVMIYSKSNISREDRFRIKAVLSPEPYILQVIKMYDDEVYNKFIQPRVSTVMTGTNSATLLSIATAAKKHKAKEYEKQQELTHRTMLQYRLPLEYYQSVRNERMIIEHQQKQQHVKEIEEGSSASTVIMVVDDNAVEVTTSIMDDAIVVSTELPETNAVSSQTTADDVSVQLLMEQHFDEGTTSTSSTSSVIVVDDNTVEIKNIVDDSIVVLPELPENIVDDTINNNLIPVDDNVSIPVSSNHFSDSTRSNTDMVPNGCSKSLLTDETIVNVNNTVLLDMNETVENEILTIVNSTSEVVLTNSTMLLDENNDAAALVTDTSTTSTSDRKDLLELPIETATLEIAINNTDGTTSTNPKIETKLQCSRRLTVMERITYCFLYGFQPTLFLHSQPEVKVHVTE